MASEGVISVDSNGYSLIDLTYSHHRNATLGLCKSFPERFKRVGEAPTDWGPKPNKRKRAEQQALRLCFLTVCAMWPAASASHCTLESLDGLYPGARNKLNPYFLRLLLSGIICLYDEKSNAKDDVCSLAPFSHGKVQWKVFGCLLPSGRPPDRADILILDLGS